MLSEKINEKLICYYINLDASTERREKFESVFDPLSLPFIRVSAVDGRKIIDSSHDFSSRGFFLRNGKRAKPGEIGCYFSHLNVLKRFLETNKEFALICEDDVSPCPEFMEILENLLLHSSNWNLVRFIACRPQTAFPFAELSQNYKLCTVITGMSLTGAYLIQRNVVESLLMSLIPMKLPYDTALYKGRWKIKEASVVPDAVFANESGAISTIEQSKKKDRQGPFHLVYWTRRFYRFQIRLIRYFIQIVRVIQRRKS